MCSYWMLQPRWPPGAVLRSLDAIHLAAALSMGSELRALLTYDGRLGIAAEAIGIEVDGPH